MCPGATAIGGAAAAYVLLARPRHLRWGATAQESDEPLAGDDLIANADLTATRAIIIRASADQVWPWIAQLGQGRSGFYSYDFLENLAGCDIHSAARIVPEWQDVGVGDEVRLAPEVGLVVAFVERGRSLVLRGRVPMGNTEPPYEFTGRSRSEMSQTRGRICLCVSGTRTRGRGLGFSSSRSRRSAS
jgi:hypothetical protein